MYVYVLAMAMAVGVVLIAALLFRKLGGDIEDRDPDGATAGHAGAMLSALFLLVFAIAIVIPWTTADSARQNTYTEAQAVVDAYWTAGELPDPASQQTRAQLTAYVQFVMDNEWPLMADGRISPAGWKLLEALRTQVNNTETKDGSAGQEARAAVLSKIQEITSARRQRAADAEASLPSPVLAIMVVTGVLVVIFPFLAGARPSGLTIVPLMVMAGLLGAGTYLAFDVTHAFNGPLAVQPDAFAAISQELQRIPVGG